MLLIGTAGFGLSRFGPQVGSAPVSPAGQSTSAAPTTPAVVDTAPATPVDAAQLLELFRAKLPVGLELSEPFKKDRVPDRPGWPSTSLVAAYTVRNGVGTGSVGIEISHTAPDLAPDGATGSASCVQPTCTTTPQPGGGNLTVRQGAGAVDGRQIWSATLEGPDGTVVWVGADNIPGPGTGRTAIYPNAPLLTAAELSALALDPAWQRVAGGLPSP
ncbi:hypothetical protein ASC99_28090 [Kitasatospora sp. Root107]|nr:hypothetical protein ASC99_28090 [Kitasatospora sp. Root107]